MVDIKSVAEHKPGYNVVVVAEPELVFLFHGKVFLAVAIESIPHDFGWVLGGSFASAKA